MLKKITIGLLLGLLAFGSEAQDPEFTQFYAAPLYINPALAGISYGPRVNLNYRNQWPSIKKGFVTYAASFDMHIDKIGGGIGVMFFGDRVANGLLNTYAVNVMYSYQLQLSRKFAIKAGVMAGYMNRQIDWNRLSFADQIDPIFGFVDEFNNPNLTAEGAPESQSVHMFDVGAGFIAFSSKVYGGLSVKHLNKPKASFTDDDESRISMRIALHGGGEIDLAPRNRRRDIALTPNFLLAQQSNFTQLNLGTYLNLNMIYAGFWFRHTFSNSDAVIGLLGLKISHFRVGYSYDYTISGLRTTSGGAHEVSLTFNLGGDDNSLNPKRKKGLVPCPGILNF